MEPKYYFLLASTMGAIAGTLIVKDVLLPRGKGNVSKTLQILLLINVFRFIGMSMYIPRVVGPDMPEGFVFPAVWGDFTAAILALLGYVLLGRGSRLAIPVVWVFNLEGFVDLLFASFQALSLKIAAQAGMMFVVFTAYAPLLIVIHIAVFRLLLIRRSA
ncbi:MAG: hypothetical protein K8S54_21225 [Spirochaetia bacterium]|nr:hypothetical protein [Spirochaetia bacterium]